VLHRPVDADIDAGVTESPHVLWREFLSVVSLSNIFFMEHKRFLPFISVLTAPFSS
jgi:hypothetical protein